MLSKDVINTVTKQIKKEMAGYSILMLIVLVGYAIIVFAKLPFNDLFEWSYIVICIIIMGLIQCIAKLSNLVKNIGNSLCKDKEHINGVSEVEVK